MTDCSASDQICEQGSCVDEPVCTPGETECFDATTRLICRPGGTGYRSEACSGDTSCFEGSCVSGSITGAACSADGDCLGGTCKCGDQSAESCAAGLEPAYCTTRCPSGSCAGDDLCFASEVFSWGSADSTYDHCIPSCNVDCEAQGMTCRDVPVYDDDGTSIIWERGCFYDQLGDVGDECDADTDCISGTCLEGYFSTGYCTLRCEDRGCPGDTACVELRTGEQWCSLKCINDAGTEKCPLDLPDDRIDASCGTRISQKSGVAVDVCISTN
jgi:hypothetical protein